MARESALGSEDEIGAPLVFTKVDRETDSPSRDSVIALFKGDPRNHWQFPFNILTGEGSGTERTNCEHNQ